MKSYENHFVFVCVVSLFCFVCLELPRRESWKRNQFLGNLAVSRSLNPTRTGCLFLPRVASVGITKRNSPGLWCNGVLERSSPCLWPNGVLDLLSSRGRSRPACCYNIRMACLSSTQPHRPVATG